MEPIHVLSDTEKRDLTAVLETVDGHPYKDYPRFDSSIRDLIRGGSVPPPLPELCAQIREERATGASDAHVVRNCPLDRAIPVLDHNDPLGDKYARKTTFVGEAFLALFARLAGTPLMAYATRFNGDFFTDVIAHNRFTGQQTGFSDGELVYHNDRTAHRIRADFITLLGMRCPAEELIYTGFVEGRTLLAGLTDEEQATLRQPFFITPFDVLSRENNPALESAPHHPILENGHSFRYLDTHTTVAANAPVHAKDALLALKNALVRAEKKRHRLLAGDLFTFANQDGLHNREKVEIHDAARARDRWLLKTYAFRDADRAARYADEWVDGTTGRVGD